MSVDGMQPLQGEGSPRAVADEPFHACTALPLHAYRAIHAEPSARLPAQHVGRGDLLEEPAPLEGPEHAALGGCLELLPVLTREQRGLVEADLATRRLAEDAVDGEHVEVEVGVQGAAEALGKGDGRELGVWNRECFATGGQHSEAGARLEHVTNEVSGRGEQMLTIVDHGQGRDDRSRLASASSGDVSAAGRTSSEEHTVDATSRGSSTGASETQNTSSAMSAGVSAAARAASRVLPTPPTPVSVTSRCSRSCADPVQRGATSDERGVGPGRALCHRLATGRQEMSDLYNAAACVVTSRARPSGSKTSIFGTV
jgi:hypothetical protein